MGECILMNIILILATIFGFILLSIGIFILFTDDDKKARLGCILGIIGILLILYSFIGISIIKSMREKHTIVITTEAGEDIYTDCRVIVTERNRSTKIVIETNDEEQIVYLNPIKYEVK